MDAYAEERRQTLLGMYPVGKTTRAQVQERFGHEPRERSKRPAGGWAKHQDPWISRYAVKAEQRISRKIPSLDRYYGADGLLSLCYCWFYFDSRDRVIDAEWQWSSD